MDVSQRVVSRNCPFCSSSAENAKLLPYGNNDWPMLECNRCHFVYLKYAPVYERLSEEFAWEKTSETERLVREEREPVKQGFSRMFKQFRQRVIKRNKLPELIEKYISEGRVLDIGCGGGGLLARLPQKYQPYGIEVSNALAKSASTVVEPRGGRIMHDNAVNGIQKLPANYFSGVLMSAFLEHEVEPKRLLQGVMNVLQPSGIVIIKVPNYGSWNRKIRAKKWCGFRLPDHVNYFTPQHLKDLVRFQGMKVLQFSLADRQPTSDNMWIVASK
jgi:2-polyprenyl-3-methyl-5-hydroxy-6-metoxy-1,4-benzoquinol methylase